MSAFLCAGVENILARAESLRPNGALDAFLPGKFESAAKGDTESLRWLFDNRVTALQSADPQSVSAVNRQPSWQTLDYVKRGLDDVLEGCRDKTTGKLALDTESKAVNDTLRGLLSRLDTSNPDYAAARAACAGPAAER